MIMHKITDKDGVVIWVGLALPYEVIRLEPGWKLEYVDVPGELPPVSMGEWT